MIWMNRRGGDSLLRREASLFFDRLIVKQSRRQVIQREPSEGMTHTRTRYLVDRKEGVDGGRSLWIFASTHAYICVCIQAAVNTRVCEHVRMCNLERRPASTRWKPSQEQEYNQNLAKGCTSRWNMCRHAHIRQLHTLSYPAVVLPCFAVVRPGGRVARRCMLSCRCCHNAE